MDISSIKRSYPMEKYDFDMQKEKLLDKLGVKSSLFAIRSEKNNVVATYLPYDLEFVYIPEGIYDKGFSVKERQQAGEINEDIIFEETEMNVEKGIFVSDILVTRTPILNSFVQKYMDFQFYEGEHGIYTGEWCSDYYETSDCESQAKEYVIKGGGAYFWPWQADEWIWCMSAMRMSSKGLVDGECGMRLVYDLNSIYSSS